MSLHRKVLPMSTKTGSRYLRYFAAVAISLAPMAVLGGTAHAHAATPDTEVRSAAPTVQQKITRAADIQVTNSTSRAIWVAKSLDGISGSKTTELVELLPGESHVWHKDTSGSEDTTLLVFGSADKQSTYLALTAHDYCEAGGSLWMHPDVLYRADGGSVQQVGDLLTSFETSVWKPADTSATGSFSFAGYNLGPADSTIAAFKISALPKATL